MTVGHDRNQSQWVASVLLAMLFGGSVTAGAIKLPFLISHPWESVGLIVLLVLAAAVISIVTGLFAKARDPFISWLYSLIRGESGRFERAYLDSVRAGIRYLENKGLPYHGLGNVAMEAVFVDPGVAARLGRDRPGLLPDVAAAGSERSTLESLLDSRSPGDRVLGVTGVPGSGKTTLLRHAAARACEEARPRLRWPGRSPRIPILLYLREHEEAIVGSPDISITDLLAKGRFRPAVPEPAGWFRSKLQAGQCTVLLDGLDEVALPEHRRLVAAWTERQISAFPECRFVISSRPGGYQDNPIGGAREVRVCGFTSEQVLDFLRRWYAEPSPGVGRRDRHPGHGSGDADRAPGEAGKLWRLLQERPAIYDLTVNPLLLTMIAAVHQENGTLPANRADLYDNICQVVLWKRAEAKGQVFPLTGRQRMKILAELAYGMMARQRTDLSAAEVEEMIGSALARMGDSVSVEDFLSREDSDGLLVEREVSRYGFAHKTFQEYLAAVHIRDSRKGHLLGELVGAVTEQWWTETSIFYASMASADPIVEACLAARTITALALACDCADAAHELSPRLRRLVGEFIDAAANPGSPVRSPEYRRDLAAVLLARHLRQRARLSEGTQVCVRPVPDGIYRMFLADVSLPEPDTPETGQDRAGAPATGLRDTDAAEFCRWVNETSDRQVTYRLPFPAEVDELARQQRIPALPSGALPSVWTQPLGSPGARLHVIRHIPRASLTSPVDLAAAVRRDLIDRGWLLSLYLTYTQAWALNLAQALDFVRATVLARARAGAGFRARISVPEAVVDVVEACALASTLGSVLDRAKEHEPVRARTRDLDRARRLVSDLVRDLDGLRSRDDALVLDLARDLDLARARANDLASAVRQGTGPVVNAKSSALNEETTGQRFDPDSVHARARKILGTALASGFRQAGTKPVFIEPGSRVFLDAFLSCPGVRGRWSVPDYRSLDTMQLRTTSAELVAALEKQSDDAAAAWAGTVCDRLVADADPVFKRRERATPERASAIRLEALCLAAEAETVYRSDIARQFQDVAAGITWLEKRHSGEIEATDVVMLAVE